MARTAQPISLPKTELRSLTTIISRGTSAARTQTRARILDLLHRGEHPAHIASVLATSVQTVFNVKRRYLSDGLDAALFDRVRSGRPVLIDGGQRAKITALACSTPPAGHARWSLRLLADKAVELQLCEHLSHNAVGEILKKRVEAAPAQDVVHRHHRRGFRRADGTLVVALLAAARSAFPGRMLRRATMFPRR